MYYITSCIIHRIIIVISIVMDTAVSLYSDDITTQFRIYILYIYIYLFVQRNCRFLFYTKTIALRVKKNRKIDAQLKYIYIPSSNPHMASLGRNKNTKKSTFLYVACFRYEQRSQVTDSHYLRM